MSVLDLLERAALRAEAVAQAEISQGLDTLAYVTQVEADGLRSLREALQRIAESDPESLLDAFEPLLALLSPAASPEDR